MILTKKSAVLLGIIIFFFFSLRSICKRGSSFILQAKEKQNQRIRTLFHRQLSVPLVNMKSTLQAYKAWEVEQGKVLDIESSDLDGISSHVATSYQKALEGYNARVHLEEQISRQDISDSERLQQFVVYRI